jgi:hypothetical protein
MGMGCAGSSSSSDDASGAENAITSGAEGVHHLPEVTSADFINQDDACAEILGGSHSKPIVQEDLARSEPELSPTGDIPVPSEEPEDGIDGRPGAFWPAKGYSEGGHFAVGTAKASQEINPSTVQPCVPGVLRVVEFNVNRGNTLDDLVKVMKQINADVYLVIETDLYGLNSAIPLAGSADSSPKRVVIGREMARALGTKDDGFYYYTSSEFYERLTPKGTPKSKLTPENDATGVGRMGTSGSTIISRYPIVRGRRADVPMFVAQGGHDWSSERLSLLGKTLGQFILKDDLQAQPRCGQRMALSATIAVPSPTGGATEITVVALHTENKSNASVRTAQFDYVLYGGTQPLLAPDQRALAIMGGDLNTLELGEGRAFRNHLSAADALIDTSSAGTASAANAGEPTGSFEDMNTKTDAFGRIDWMIEQPGTNLLAVQNYVVGPDSGGSDHHPIWVDFVLSRSDR